ncbi:MAG: transporter substrate-binding domain-containing protein [Gammaproteobacteria bacterium]|nr:transporter substrate-binding domain-containing protein [Gammaproteobacteria bacterium]
MRLLAALFGLMCLGGAQARNLLCPQALQAGWDPWEPYHYKDGHGRITGSATEILREAARRVGCELRFVENTWARTVTDIQVGRLDVAMEAQLTPERRGFALFSRPYRRIDVQLWVLSTAIPEPQADTLDALLKAKVRIGALAGYAYGESADKALEKASLSGQVQYVRSNELNLRKLIAQRVDGFLADTASSRQLSLPPDSPLHLVSHPRLRLSQDVRLMFSQEGVPRALVEQFDAALEQMSADGSLAALLARFHPEGAFLASEPGS